MTDDRAILKRFNPGALGGLTLQGWLRLLRQNGFDIDPAYWPRATAISLFSLANTILKVLEDLLYSKKVREAGIEPPLFILGMARSGTTHLHNLLGLDRRFACPNFYQVRFPHIFLTTENLITRLTKPLLPQKRAQDDVRLGWKIPSEDEIALCVITLRSYLLRAVFPRRADFHIKYRCLRDVPVKEVEEWKEAMILFLKKLSLKYKKPLIIKSPEHICRIKFLLEIFPEAKFVHIYRNPYAVYQSIIRMRETLRQYRALQKSPIKLIGRGSLTSHQEIYSVFFEERKLIPEGHLHEISYEDLERDPIGIVHGIYEELDLGDFSEVEPAIRRYAASLSGYRKNVYPEIPADLRRRIARECRRCFEEWGYPI